ncbi:MAG: hypothetical protein E7631_13490 [Ruminococcaceae bacterium]|nr:hypothetical protein [Oscillospiraceae bacterium]
MSIRKTLLLLFAALLLSQSLAGCAAETAETEPSGETTENTAETLSPEDQKHAEKEAYFAALPAAVKNPGTDICILTEVNDIFWEEEGLNGERLNDTMYNRNVEVEERLGVNIVQDLRAQDSGEVTATITQNVLAGTGTYALVNNFTREIANMFAVGVLGNMNEIPYLQREENWWNQSANKNLSYGGYQFCAISSLNRFASDLTTLVMFNKDMCIDYNIGLPYDAVREGTWTYDMMFTMMDSLPLDSNGDGSMDEKDIVGMVAQSSDIASAVAGCGVDFFTKDENDFPQFILGTDELNASKFETIFNVFSNRQRTVVVEYYGLDNVWGYWQEKFVSGEALFFPNFPCNLSAYAEIEDDYGILPMPKYDEKQENYRAMTSLYFTSCLALPKVVDADVGDIGLTLDALSYLTYVDVDPEYVATYLENRYLRDEESAEMMTIALQSTYFDPGFAMHYQWGKPLELLSQIVGSGENTFASTIASKAASIQNKADATKELIQ